ncbi:MAG: APC family permease, partial [Terriglobales bacterium]
IFIVSAQMSRQLQSPGLLLLAWLVTGFLTIAGALCYGELAAAMPHAGGQYVYLRESLGSIFGFLYGWTLFVVIQTGTIAAVAIAFSKFLGVVLPSVSGSRWLFLWGHWGPVSLGLNTQELVAVAAIVVLTYFNSRGVKTGAWIQNIFTAAKILALLAVIALGFFVARNAGAVVANFHHFWSGMGWGHWHVFRANGRTMVASTLGVVFIAMVGSLFSSDSWNNITFTAGEVRNPRRNIPLSLVVGTGAVTVLYLLANLAYLNVLPLFGQAGATTALGRGIQHASEDRVATAVMSVLFGHLGAVLMALAILISCFGCVNGLILSGARVYYAMAKDRLFFHRISQLHPRTRVPVFGLWIQAVWACLLCLSGTYNQLLEYVMFAEFLFYILTIAGLFLLRWRRPDMPRPYRALAYPVLPALYLVGAVFFDVEIFRVFPSYTGAGLLLVLIGVPVYFLWKLFGARRPQTTTP